nr:sister chromatid cohesion protein dcc1 [Quercus suber]
MVVIACLPLSGALQHNHVWPERTCVCEGVVNARKLVEMNDSAASWPVVQRSQDHWLRGFWSNVQSFGADGAQMYTTPDLNTLDSKVYDNFPSTMSTQSGSESRLTFSITPQDHQQHLRLLELPPDVLNLITSDNPPILQLKSLDRQPGQLSDSNAVLCTPDKTFNLRQVNHSNSVFVTKPSRSQQSEANDSSQPALEAVAQSTFTLELTAAKDVPAHAYLQSALPVHSGGGSHTSHTETPLTKLQHFANVPLDQHQCEQAWREMACFELKDCATSFTPSASSRNGAWNAILVQAVAEGIDLTSELTTGDVQMLTHLDGDEWPPELCQAILDSMTLSTEDGRFEVDGNQCARLNGIALLREHVKGSAHSAAEFAEKWKDSLPEKWRSKADLKLLEGSYKLVSSDIIYLDRLYEDASAMNDAAGVNTKATKRKWHDKFRASKKKA